MIELKRKPQASRPIIPYTEAWTKTQNTNYPNNILSHKARVLLNCQDKPTHFPDKEYDLVYILKPSENNPDLRYSLRSVAKFCNFRRVWVIGYKPSWIKNVRYIPTLQKGTKWKNSTLNWLTACKCSEISDNFILMNDDFFAIKPINNWEEELNVCLSQICTEINKYTAKKKSRWQSGFEYAENLLSKLHCKNTHCYEAHVPIIVNKQNFITTMQEKPIVEFTSTTKVLHKRTIYKNLYPYSIQPRQIKDVKISLGKDLSDVWLDEAWLSVFDDTVGNTKQFPKLNQFLNSMFPNKCKFEI